MLFLPTLTQIAACLPLYHNLLAKWHAGLRLALQQGRAGRRELAASRELQAGVKYWFTVSGVLAAILVFSAKEDTKAFQKLRPLFTFVATAMSMTERVSYSTLLFRLHCTVLSGIGCLAA